MMSALPPLSVIMVLRDSPLLSFFPWTTQLCSRVRIVAKGIDNVPTPSHIIIVVRVILCLPHELGA
jgi:hypothetical protein